MTDKENAGVSLYDDIRAWARDGFIAKVNAIYLGAFDVLLYLISIANCNNIATVSLQTIARNTGFSRETVRKMVRELEKQDVIMRLHCARGKEMDYAILTDK